MFYYLQKNVENVPQNVELGNPAEGIALFVGEKLFSACRPFIFYEKAALL